MENELSNKLKASLEPLKNAPAPADLKREILGFAESGVKLPVKSSSKSRFVWPALASSFACVLAVVFLLRSPQQASVLPAEQLSEAETEDYLATVFEDDLDDALLNDEFWNLEEVI